MFGLLFVICVRRTNAELGLDYRVKCLVGVIGWVRFVAKHLAHALGGEVG